MPYSMPIATVLFKQQRTLFLRLTMWFIVDLFVLTEHSHFYGYLAQAQSSSLSRLGSKIARTVKRNKKVLTISLKNVGPPPRAL